MVILLMKTGRSALEEVITQTRKIDMAAVHKEIADREQS